jgi:hypothetical protein
MTTSNSSAAPAAHVRRRTALANGSITASRMVTTL